MRVVSLVHHTAGVRPVPTPTVKLVHQVAHQLLLIPVQPVLLVVSQLGVRVLLWQHGLRGGVVLREGSCRFRVGVGVEVSSE